MHEVSAVRRCFPSLLWENSTGLHRDLTSTRSSKFGIEGELYRPTSGPDFTNTPVAVWEQRFTEEFGLLQQQNHSFVLKGSTDRHPDINRVVRLVHELLCRCIRRLDCFFMPAFLAYSTAECLRGKQVPPFKST